MEFNTVVALMNRFECEWLLKSTVYVHQT